MKKKSKAKREQQELEDLSRSNSVGSDSNQATGTKNKKTKKSFEEGSGENQSAGNSSEVVSTNDVTGDLSSKQTDGDNSTTSPAKKKKKKKKNVFDSSDASTVVDAKVEHPVERNGGRVDSESLDSETFLIDRSKRGSSSNIDEDNDDAPNLDESMRSYRIVSPSPVRRTFEEDEDKDTDEDPNIGAERIGNTFDIELSQVHEGVFSSDSLRSKNKKQADQKQLSEEPKKLGKKTGVPAQLDEEPKKLGKKRGVPTTQLEDEPKKVGRKKGKGEPEKVDMSRELLEFREPIQKNGHDSFDLDQEPKSTKTKSVNLDQDRNSDSYKTINLENEPSRRGQSLSVNVNVDDDASIPDRRSFNAGGDPKKRSKRGGQSNDEVSNVNGSKNNEPMNLKVAYMDVVPIGESISPIALKDSFIDDSGYAVTPTTSNNLYNKISQNQAALVVTDQSQGVIVPSGHAILKKNSDPVEEVDQKNTSRRGSNAKETDIDEDSDEEEDYLTGEEDQLSIKDLTALAKRLINPNSFPSSRNSKEYEPEYDEIDEQYDDVRDDDYPLDRSRPLCTIKEMPREGDESSNASQHPDSKRSSKLLDDCEWEELHTLVQQPVMNRSLNRSFDLDVALQDVEMEIGERDTRQGVMNYSFEKVKGKGRRVVPTQAPGSAHWREKMDDIPVRMRRSREDILAREKEDVVLLVGNGENPSEEIRAENDVILKSAGSGGSRKRPDRPKLPTDRQQSTSSIGDQVSKPPEDNNNKVKPDSSASVRDSTENRESESDSESESSSDGEAKSSDGKAKRSDERAKSFDGKAKDTQTGKTKDGLPDSLTDNAVVVAKVSKQKRPKTLSVFNDEATKVAVPSRGSYFETSFEDVVPIEAVSSSGTSSASSTSPVTEDNPITESNGGKIGDAEIGNEQFSAQPFDRRNAARVSKGRIKKGTRRAVALLPADDAKISFVSPAKTSDEPSNVEKQLAKRNTLPANIKINRENRPTDVIRPFR